MKKILFSILALFISSTILVAPAFATCSQSQLDNGCVSTSILGNGCSCDDGKGSGITDILELVVRIMTIGIGILGAIGITVSGVQYLTAGGNEEQTRKAKRRIFEIIIGLAVYVLIVALLTWLLPGFQPLS